MTINQKVSEAWIEKLQNEGNLVYVDNTPISDEQVLEILKSGTEVHSEHENSCRWWEEWSYVVKIGDRYFSYAYAEANRDESVRELGYDWDIDSVEEVEPYVETVVVTKYRRKA